MGKIVGLHSEIDYVQAMHNYLDSHKKEVNDLRYSIDSLTAERSEIEERFVEIKKELYEKRNKLESIFSRFEWTPSGFNTKGKADDAKDD